MNDVFKKALVPIAIGLILGTFGPSTRAATPTARQEGMTVILAGEPGTRLSYELRAVVPANARRGFPREETIRGAATLSAEGTAEIDLAPVVARIPSWDPTVDAIQIEGFTPTTAGHGIVEIAQDAATTGSSGVSTWYHIRRDVAGPDFNGLGNNAEDFTVDHHAFIVENTRSTMDDTDGPSLNTGGIAVVLHSDGNDDLSVFDLGSYDFNDHVLNTINRNDHFMTFFRERADGVQDIVGRIEGLSFWDMGEINQQLVDFFNQSGHLPWNWLDLNVTFNDPADWLQVQWPSLSHSGSSPSFSRGRLPYLAYNNLSCEGNANEVCIGLPAGAEIDMTFDPGALANINWGYLDDPFMGLSLNPGSVSGTPPIEFGSPFLQVNESAANQFASDLEDFFGSVAPVAYEMKTDPVGFAAKYLFALRGGVTYESGSGDYAEWLERMDPDETLQAGEIVGVFGGKVTRKTVGADHAMVVSYKPVVLGNMPAKEHADRFEKIAFMGQTLVKVVGVVREGDYILPSGRGDGTGMAVRPEDIVADQLSSVVGIAWGTGGTPGRLGLVNVAVGLRPVEITRVVSDQQAALRTLRDEHAAAKLEIARLQSQVDTMQAALHELGDLRDRIESLLATRVARDVR